LILSAKIRVPKFKPNISMNNTIKIKNLRVRYDEKIALEIPNLEIIPGSVIGVLGPNGAGKSTLFKSILGIIEYEGEITFDGKPIDEFRKKIAYIPQRSDVDWQFPATVYDIVETGRYAHKKIFQRMDQNDKKIVENALELTSISDLRNRQIGELSGGQQQRVFIARALAQEADFFFMDEPFVGIDATSEERIVLLIKELAKQNKVVMVIHHDLQKAKSYFDEVILVQQKITAAGDTLSVLNEENLKKTYRSLMSL
jgi:manganese transport system ATP-binding protein